MTVQSEAMQRMLKARAGLVMSEPFFGTLAMTKLELVEDSKCKTHWTDGKRLGFNPGWAMDTPIEDIQVGVAHQVLTCALGHPFRRNSREERLWNDASDYVVNGELKGAGFSLPPDAKLDPRFEGMATEAVYAQLQQEQMPPPDQGGNDSTPPSEGGNESSPGGGGQNESKPGDQSPEAGDQEGEGSGNSMGEVKDATGDSGEDEASEAENTEQEHEWRVATAQAAQVAKGAGHLPGGIERALKEMLEPKVDWREALQRLLRSRAKDDYSWRRGSRRAAAFDMYLPALDSPSCGVLAFAVDMSGSISQRDIDQFVSEVVDAGSQVRPKKILVIPFDHGVRRVLEFDPGEPIEVRERAGGGTSFIEPVAELERREIEPEVLVFLTDLGSSQFADEPRYPVVWVTTQPGAAPYGDVINMF